MSLIGKAVGFISKTAGRLMGAGLGNDSRLVNASANWTDRDAGKDWRVRLTIPTDSPVRGVLFENNKLLDPLKPNNGIFWPLTPNMIIQHSANYNTLEQTHSNYPHYAYQNSQVDQINIIGEFPVQNSTDAKQWVATVHFLRTVTKMFFGNKEDPNGLKGSPPPILHLSGYGDNMFSKIPVIINTFNVELRAGIDYISTKQGLNPTKEEEITEIRNRWSTINSPHFNGDYEAVFKGTKSGDGEEQTWAPTLSNISVLITPIYSRDSVKKFSMRDFATGRMSGKNNDIGFI